jgi:hypothetical protein
VTLIRTPIGVLEISLPSLHAFDQKAERHLTLPQFDSFSPDSSFSIDYKIDGAEHFLVVAYLGFEAYFC